MLSLIGPTVLRWLDEVLVEVGHRLDDFSEYVTRWRELIEDAA